MQFTLTFLETFGFPPISFAADLLSPKIIKYAYYAKKKSAIHNQSVHIVYPWVESSIHGYVVIYMPHSRAY